MSRRRRTGDNGGRSGDGRPEMPIDVHVHVDTSNHELERKLVEGYGRIELLHKLEFDLMRQEFGTAIESLSDQVQRLDYPGCGHMLMLEASNRVAGPRVRTT